MSRHHTRAEDPQATFHLRAQKILVYQTDEDRAAERSPGMW
jgi:hypothetical protein